MLAFWQPVLMNGARITDSSRSEMGLWAWWSLHTSRDRKLHLCAPSPLLLAWPPFFSLSSMCPCCSPSPSNHEVSVSLSVLLKTSFSAHFGYRLYQLTSMYVTCNVMYSSACSSLIKQVYLCLSLRGLDVLSRKNNFSLQLKIKNDTFFIPLIGHNIKAWTLPM